MIVVCLRGNCSCLNEPDREDSDDDMGPESQSAESRSINAGIDDRRVDHFWSKVFELRYVTGRERFTALQKVVMASLVIAHGNADVERGLSDNKRVVSKKRTKMSLDNIIGVRATQDAVRFYDPNNAMLRNYQSLDGCSLLFGTRMLRTKRDWR